MAISYELAKELKDAGFPQILMRGYLRDGIYHPSLSELIEACGNGFSKLSRIGAEFSAPDYLGKITATYVTPEEAVARLFITISNDEA